MGHGVDGATHAARELGSWDLALAAGMVFAALRPARAWGMLPLVAAVVAGLTVTSLIDAARSDVELAREVAYLLAVLGLSLLWWIATPAGKPRLPQPA